jgi:dihydrofolate reductase
MSKVRASISMSLDGYGAGPDQSLDQPLGVGGERLHEWIIALDVFHEMSGDATPGVTNASSAVVRGWWENVGAVVMGRNMFGGGPGPWRDDWRGWWGEDPPYHVPVFVITHHAREPLEMQGGTTFHFVTDGIEHALERAEAAAGSADAWIMGGASVINQYLAAGLVEELELSISPVLLGAGERLFEGVPDPGLEQLRVVEAPGVTHIRYRVTNTG